MAEQDERQARRSRSRSRTDDRFDSHQFEHFATRVVRAMAQDIRTNFIQIAEWRPPDINIMFIEKRDFQKLHIIFTNPDLKWIWYDKDWWYYNKNQNPRHYCNIDYVQNTEQQWRITIVVYIPEIGALVRT